MYVCVYYIRKSVDVCQWDGIDPLGSSQVGHCHCHTDPLPGSGAVSGSSEHREVTRDNRNGRSHKEILVNITTWSRVLVVELIVTQLVKKFPAFYAIIKVYYRVRKSPPLVLIRARWIQSTPFHSTVYHLCTNKLRAYSQLTVRCDLQ
jgi:hypothetical protein